MPTYADHSHTYNTMPQAAVHSFRHLPHSSSDTDHGWSHISPVPLFVNPAADVDMTPAADPYLDAVPELQARRTSILSYQNSGYRDPNDRSYSRSPRNLVVVIPPPDLPLNQGQLGNVLSTGPRHRLSQGILMPLFSSVSICFAPRPSSSR